MHIMLIQLDLHIPDAQSLKDKRREIKSIKDRLMSRFNVSVAEVGELELWQQAKLAICAVSNDRAYLEQQFSAIENLVLECAAIQVSGIQRDWL